VYRPAEIILREEGGKDSATAIQVTINIVRKCRQTGGKWMIYNWMSERPEYLHLSREHTEVMNRCWRLYQTWKDKAGSASSSTAIEVPETPEKTLVQPSAALPQVPQPVVAAAKGTKRAAEQSDGKKAKKLSKGDPAEEEETEKAQNGDTEKGKEQNEKEKQKARAKQQLKQLSGALTGCNKVKSTYQSALASFTHFRNQCETNIEWKWATSEDVMGPINTAKKNMESVVDDFFTNFMCLDLPSLKKHFPDPAELTLLALNLPSKTGKFVDAFSKEVSRVHQMHMVKVSCT
jgi:hypothetical protein